MQLHWLSLFTDLVKLEPSSQQILAKTARLVVAPVGKICYSEGMPCNAYILRLEGKSRVYKLSTYGREILLYRVGAGQSCVLTTTCLLGKSHYPASTIVEEKVTDVVIPAATFHQLMIDSPVFRAFVLKNYGALISDLIVLLDEVAFHGLDIRLAKLLLDTQTLSINRTHQQIADELGTAREVVSRQLKILEKQGLVKLARGLIKILDRKSLEKIL